MPIYRSSYYRGTNPEGSLLHENRLVVSNTIFIFSLLPLRNGNLPAQDGRFIAIAFEVDPIAPIGLNYISTSIPSHLWQTAGMSSNS